MRPANLPKSRRFRKQPTAKEATQMQWAVYDIDLMASRARSLGDSVSRVLANPDEYVAIDFGDMDFTFDEAIPTLLILKLSAAFEDALDTLWSIRFPEVNKKSLRHDDKLRVMERLHRVDLSAVRQLWEVRNKCAHSVRTMATWDDFDKYF